MLDNVTVEILIVYAWYLPGFRAGGPVRSLSNLVRQIGDRYRFRVISRDRDLGSRERYPDIQDGWNQVDGAQVWFLPPGWRAYRDLLSLLRSTSAGLIYFNSFFSPLTRAGLFFRRVGLLPRKPVLICARGEFSQGSLGLKSVRKSVYLQLAGAAGLWNGVRWHATTEPERQDIMAVAGRGAIVHIAPNLTGADANAGALLPRAKDRSHLKVVFYSRISSMKNLEFAAGVLARLTIPVQFDIVGPIENQLYWQRCSALLEMLPPNITVRRLGGIAPGEAHAKLSQYHVLFLPTLGENFGHAIIEALLAGCMVLISDRTPWRNLQQTGAGWDLPLSMPDAFANALNECADLDQEEFDRRSIAAVELGRAVAYDPRAIEAYHELFGASRQS